jgi:cysteine-rich repeat protein
MKKFISLIYLWSAGCTLLTGAFGVACGDGFIQTGEECDDGNAENGDGCDNTCIPTACGNAVLTPPEECDDGNNLNNDGCSNNCTIEIDPCGNGIIVGLEECDDSNLIDNDGCDSNCTFTRCGNRIINIGEDCDDGNTNPGDGCNGVCEFEIPPNCGNGNLNPLEECDDGNNIPGDGCEFDCKLICGTGTEAFRAKQGPDGNCYLGFTEDISWQEAEANCEAINGYLAVIDDDDESVFARSLLSAAFGPWIGFNDIDIEADTDPFKFSKVTGGPLSFNGFASGQPSNSTAPEDCVHFFQSADGDPNKWNDNGCQASGFTSGYLCELEPNPCGDGIVHSNEACDDGNNLNNDGCASDCIIE